MASSTASSWKWKTVDRIEPSAGVGAARSTQKVVVAPGCSHAGSTPCASLQPDASCTKTLITDLDVHGRLRRREPRHGHAERRAADVVQAGLLEKVDG